MKKFIAIIGAFALLASTAMAQIGLVSPSGSAHRPVTTNTGPLLVEGSGTTNIPVHAAYMLPVPANGFGLYLRTGGTNSASTTNLVAVFDLIIFPSTGVTQVVDNASFTLSTPTTATTLPTGYDYLTNITAASTLLNLQHVDALRLRSIQNTNLASIWVSNFVWLSTPPKLPQ